MIALRSDFAVRVVRWQLANGRHDLPWQQVVEPYRVWLSEIMLQQTQVGTVVDYYARFLRRFPDLDSLAAADLDEVLAVWSGLGYYSRARNLHRCAREVKDRFGGSWPESASVLQSLPGIGRSTAAAIAAFCFGERVAILDGNVRRVLARVLGFDLDLSSSANLRQLWALAEELLPVGQLSGEMPAYTQGLMDIGAMLCRARRPSCESCPVAMHCVAYQTGKPEAFPVRSRKLPKKTETLWLLWVTRPDGSTWVERRPAVGIWSGLFCLPAFSSLDSLEAVISSARLMCPETLPAVSHALTHKNLVLQPVRVSTTPSALTPGEGGMWVAKERLADLGLPAPIRRILNAAH